MTTAEPDDPDGGRFRALAAADRIGRFVSVCVVGATLETAIVALLTTGVIVATVPPLAAKAVGAEASITLMFLLNDRWTFAEEADGGLASLLGRYGRSHVVRLAGCRWPSGRCSSSPRWSTSRCRSAAPSCGRPSPTASPSPPA